MIWIILWYVIGLISFNVACFFYDGQITVRDVCVSVPAAILGPIMILVAGIILGSDTVFIRRKK